MNTKEIELNKDLEKEEELELNSFDQAKANKLIEDYIKYEKLEKKNKTNKELKLEELESYMESTGVKELSHEGKDAKIYSKETKEVNLEKLLLLKGKKNKRGDLVINEDDLSDLLHILSVGKTNAVKIMGETKIKSIEDTFSKPEKLHITKSKKGS